MSRSPSDVTPRARGHATRHLKGMSVGNILPFYPSQLSLFVLFEKKAGLIRIADAAVGEVELYDDGAGSVHHLLPSGSSASSGGIGIGGSGGAGSLGRRSRASWDGRGFVKDSKAAWIAPCAVEFAEPDLRRALAQRMYILTRGKQSHVLPHPLPAALGLTPPYRVLHWAAPPAHVCAHVARGDGGAPAMHFVAFGEDGVEVQEVPLSRLSQRAGKAREDEPLRAQTDVGAVEAGFLAAGGHWHKPPGSVFTHTPRDSIAEEDSDEDLSPEELLDAMHAEEGMYGWVRKGTEDWRVIWLGGGGQSEGSASDGSTVR